MSDIHYSDLETFCKEPQQEIANIKKSFEEHISLVPDTKFRPKLMLFDFFGTKKFGISSKLYDNEKDFYISISEMLYAYSGFNAGSCLLVLDSNSKINDNSSGALVIYFASDDAAASIKLYYHQTESNSIEWIESEYEYQQIDLKSKDSSNRIIELLFVHTHLDREPFTQSELLSYYSLKGYNFRSFKDLKTFYIDYSFKN